MSVMFENMLSLKRSINDGYGVAYTTGNGSYMNSVYWSKNKEESLAYAEMISRIPRATNYKTEIYFYDANSTHKVWRVSNSTSKVVYGNSIVDHIKYGLYTFKHYFMLHSVGRFVYNIFGSEYI